MSQKTIFCRFPRNDSQEIGGSNFERYGPETLNRLMQYEVTAIGVCLIF